MQIEIKIDDGCVEPKIIVVTSRVTDEINGIVKKLAGEQSQMIAGFQDERVIVLEPGQIPVIWELDSWSLAKQSGIYFMIACILMLLIAYIANWMEHSISGVISYVGVFVAIFIAMWLAQYLSWKRKIKKMNALVKKGKDMEQM